MATVNVLMYGLPADIETTPKAETEVAKVDYYATVTISNTMVSDQWRSQAILYRR